MGREEHAIEPPAADRWFFDGWSRVYDFTPIQWLAYWPVHDAVLEMLGEGVRDVLDVGCGTGHLAARIGDERPGARVVGCDFSRGMLSQARARPSRAQWVLADAGRLPLRSESFDAVVSTEAFHWFPDPDGALSEFQRVLRPGGTLLLALVNVPNRMTSALFRLGSRIVGEPFTWPTREDLAAQIERAGLRVAEQRRLFRLPGALLLPPVLTRARRPAEGER